MLSPMISAQAEARLLASPIPAVSSPIRRRKFSDLSSDAGADAPRSPVGVRKLDTGDPSDETDPTLASPSAITINLITMGLGTGLLTMPWGVAGASIVTSCVWLAICLILNYWTIMLLVRAADQLQEFDLGAMLGRLPGSMGSRLNLIGNGIVISSQFLVLLGYTIVIVDTMVQVSPEGSLLKSRAFDAAMIMIFVLPLSFLDQKYLAYTSSVSILANVYLIALLIFYALAPAAATHVARQEWTLCVFGWGKGSVTMLSLLMYTIIFQMVIPPMYQELQGRTPAKFRSCLIVAFVCLFFIFAAVMICGYFVFGPSVDSNVMNSFPTDVWGSLARVAMALCVLGCYPLNVKPMAAPFAHNSSPPPEPQPFDSFLAPVAPKDGTQPLLDSGAQKPGIGGGVIVATTVIIAVVSVTSLWVDGLGPLNAINGAVQVVGYIGLIPGVIGLYALEGVGLLERAALKVLIVFAIISCVLGFIMTDNDVAGLAASCALPWTSQNETNVNIG